MEASSDEFWDIDGVPLNSYCWAVKTVGGSRNGLPPLRGDNKLYPNQPGRSFAPKVPDSRVITMAMWVAGVDPDTGLPSRSSQSIQWNDNWKTLKRLVWTPRREINLTRRWYENADSPVLMSATAKAQIAGQMEPAMTGRGRADFAMDLLLADPYFYGTEISMPVPLNQDFVINNPGDDKVSSKHFSITFEGELPNPTLRNVTTGVWMSVNTYVSLDTHVAVDVSKYTASRSTDGKAINTAISHGGARRWMELEPGNNVIRLETSVAGSGRAVLKFRPPYV